MNEPNRQGTPYPKLSHSQLVDHSTQNRSHLVRRDPEGQGPDLLDPGSPSGPVLASGFLRTHVALGLNHPHANDRRLFFPQPVLLGPRASRILRTVQLVEGRWRHLYRGVLVMQRAM